MKSKILGIVVCMLMFASVLPIAGSTNVQNILPTTLGKITIKIVATVTDVSDSNNLLGGAIQVDDTITGKYTYNSWAPDSAPSEPQVGYYQYSSIPYGIEVKAGGFVFKTNPSDVDFQIWIYDNIVYYGNPPFDMFQVVSDENLPLSNGMSVDFVVWELGDSTGTVLSSTDLPTTAPVLTDWGVDILLIQGKDPSDSHKGYTIFAHVTEATKNSAVDVNEAEYARRTPSVTIPFSCNLPFMPFWMKILERFPHAFPILRHMMGY